MAQYTMIPMPILMLQRNASSYCSIPEINIV
jgi:hypothetical protein